MPRKFADWNCTCGLDRHLPLSLSVRYPAAPNYRGLTVAENAINGFPNAINTPSNLHLVVECRTQIENGRCANCLSDEMASLITNKIYYNKITHSLTTHIRNDYKMWNWSRKLCPKVCSKSKCEIGSSVAYLNGRCCHHSHTLAVHNKSQDFTCMQSE